MALFVPVEPLAIGFSYPLLARSPILDQLGPATVAVVAECVEAQGARDSKTTAQTADATETNRRGPRRWEMPAEPSETTDLENPSARPTCTHDVAHP